MNAVKLSKTWLRCFQSPKFSSETRPSSKPCARIFRPQDGEPIWIGVRKRSQQDSVDDAENGNRCADADGERESDDGAQRRAAPEEPQGVANVAPEMIPAVQTAGLVKGFSHCGDVAEAFSGFGIGVDRLPSKFICFDGEVRPYFCVKITE